MQGHILFSKKEELSLRKYKIILEAKVKGDTTLCLRVQDKGQLRILILN